MSCWTGDSDAFYQSQKKDLDIRTDVRGDNQGLLHNHTDHSTTPLHPTHRLLQLNLTPNPRLAIGDWVGK